jgi:hypothetical protein
MELLRGLLQFGPFVWHDRPFHRANLQADAAVNAGGEVDPVPVGAFDVFAGAGVDAGNGASVYTVGYALAGLGDDRMGHGSL